MPHLHRNLSVVDKDLAGQEVGSDSGLVARAELFVDLEGEHGVSRGVSPHGCHRGRLMALTYWFIKLVLPTPLSPRMITCAKLTGQSSGIAVQRGASMACLQ